MKEENENIVLNVLKNVDADIIPIEKELFKGVEFLKSNIDGTLLVAPNKFYEGFFIARMRKK